MCVNATTGDRSREDTPPTSWEIETTVLRDVVRNVHSRNTRGTALMLAAFKGHVAVVEALLDEGADVNHATGQGTTALSLAAMEGHLDIVETLLEDGADVNQASSTGSALMLASMKGHVEVVRALLDAGADVNV